MLIVLIVIGAVPSMGYNLNNGSLSLDIRADNGAIDTVTFGGSDFFNPGTPVSNYGFQLGTSTATFAVNDTSGGTGQSVVVTSGTGTITATGTYTKGGANVIFARTYALVPGQNVIQVTTQLTNNAATSVTLRYFDTFDPDQGSGLGLGFSTFNDVLALATGAGSISVGQAYASNDLTFVLGPTAPGAAVVSSGTYFNIGDGTTLNTVFSSPADGNGAFQDSGTHIIYELMINASQTVTVTTLLSFGTTHSAAQSAFIASFDPTVTTHPATSVTFSTATLQGTVKPNGQATTGHFRYGTDPTLTTGTNTADQNLGSGTTAVAFSDTEISLLSQTIYYFEAVATNATGTATGAILSFTTPAQPPTVTTLPATAIVPTGALMNCSVNPNGTSTTIHFDYSTDAGLAGAASTATQNIGSGTAAVSINGAVIGLTPRTTYYFRAVATNAGGTVNGGIFSFYTGTVGWGGAGSDASTGTLDATLIPTNGTHTFANINGQGFYIVVTTSGMGDGGGASYFGDPDWWLQGGAPNSGYGTLTFRFYDSLTNQPYALTDVDFRLLDAEVNERFRDFGYWDANNNFVSVAYGTGLLTFSNTPIYHATDNSYENSAQFQGGDQLNKWIELNLSGLAVTGFTLESHRQTSSAGSVIMSDFVSPWAAWRTANFGSPPYPASADDFADPDGDGNANILEYFFGTNPNVANSPNPLQLGVVASRLTLSFPRSLSATDTTATIQGADSASGPWTDLARSINGGAFAALVLGVPVSETGAGIVRNVQVGDQYIVTDPGHPTRFLRLQVVH